MATSDEPIRPRPAAIEIRSIDYIPESERHGGLTSQFTLWLGANLQITAIVTGALAVCVMYVGFSASGSVLAGQAVAQLLHVGDGAGIVIFGCFIVVITLFGYRVIHMLGRVASVVGMVAFFYMFSRLFATHDIAALLDERHFSLNQFLLAMSLSASWQIAYGPYVADYSRYLPPKTSTPGAFTAVFLGSVLGSQISMTFGVFAAALGGKQFEHREVPYIVGLGSSGMVATVLFFCIAFGKVTATTLNSYGSFMSMATIVSGFRRGVRISIRFLTRSRYDVPALSDPDGRYGRWNALGITIYLLGILVQMPFLSSTFYTGPLVERLGGADVSWIVGLIVPAALYYAFARDSRRPADPNIATAV